MRFIKKPVCVMPSQHRNGRVLLRSNRKSVSQLPIFIHTSDVRLGWGSAIVLAGSVSGASLHVTEARGKGRGTLRLERAAAGKCRPSIEPQCEGRDLNPARAPSCTIKAPKSQQIKIRGGLFLF